MENLVSTISEGGNVVIPEGVRAGLRLLPGQLLYWTLRDGASCIVSFSPEPELPQESERERLLRHPFFGCDRQAVESVESEMERIREVRSDAL